MEVMRMMREREQNAPKNVAVGVPAVANGGTGANGNRKKMLKETDTTPEKEKDAM
jgi:hypothetical protein